MAFATQYGASFQAVSVGQEVVAIRAEGLRGRVIAVLRDAIYLESEGGHIMGIVDGETDGPLALRVDNLPPLLSALRSQQGAAFYATEDALHIAGVASLRWARAARWTPTLPQTLGSSPTRQQAAHALAEAIAGVGQSEGCAPAVVQLVGARRASLAVPLRTDVAISSRIIANLNQAREAVHTGSYAEAAVALTSLIGLGPGLTPSGDDLVAGIVASLVWQKRFGIVPAGITRTLVDAIRQVAPTRTNRISTRLLWHACEGVLYASAMDLGAALLSGDVGAILRSYSQLFSIGHTTGVDLASGLLFGAILGQDFGWE